MLRQLVNRTSPRVWLTDAGLECQYCNCEEQINVSQMCKTPQSDVKNAKMAAIFFSQLSLWYHVAMTFPMVTMLS